MWSTERTLKLIHLIHSTPILWDASSQDYRSRHKKLEAYKRLADRLSVDVNEVDKKFKALKIQLRREFLKVEKAKRNGCQKRCTWFGYEPLKFLLQSHDGLNPDPNATKFETMEMNVKTEYDSDFGPDETAPATPQPSHTTTRHHVTPDDDTYTILKTLSDHVVRKRDEYHVFGEHIANKFRSCGRSRQEISIAQHKINEIIFELEMGYFGPACSGFSFDAAPHSSGLKVKRFSLGPSSTGPSDSN